MSRAVFLSAFLALSAVTLEGQTAPPWSTGTYVYDGAANVKSIGTDQFRYDAHSRMVSGAAGPGRTQSATYDPYGNITTLTTDGNALTFGVDPATNRLTNTSYNVFGTYDNAGRLLTASGIGNTFQYDGLDTVSRTTVDNTTKVHLYTASDERLASVTVAGGQPVRWDWTLRDASGKVLRRLERVGPQWTWKEDSIYRGTQLLAAEVDTREQVLHFYPDHVGSPRLITGNGGAKVSFHTYFPFGEEATASNQDHEKLKFTGHERDAASLDYMHARYYQVKWGRFLSVDPSTDDVSMSAPQTWNKYTYVKNNPVNRIDPDGRAAMLVTAGVGALTGAGFQIAINLASGEDWDKDVVKEMAIGAALGVTGIGIAKVIDKGYDGYKTIKAAQATTQIASAASRNVAYEIAAAGGKHAGTLRNYATRSAAEVAKGVKGHEKQVAIHLDKLKNPSKYVEKWAELTEKHQQSLIRHWESDIVRNREMAEVLRGLLSKVR